jgi:hypothetical protein
MDYTFFEYAVAALAILGFAFFVYKKMTKKSTATGTGTGGGGGGKDDHNTVLK